MNPLKNWYNLRRGYKFGDKTTYNDFHIGLDVIVPEGTPKFAPYSGEVTHAVREQGGNTVYLFAVGKVFRFLHLSKFGKIGKVRKGDIIGYTGDTGLSTGPHLHHDISRNSLKLDDISNFIDPEVYYAPKTIKVFVVTNKTYWNYRKKLIEIRKLVSEYTDGQIQLSFTCKDVHLAPEYVIQESTMGDGTKFVGAKTFKPFLKEAKDCDIIVYYQDTKEAWPDTNFGAWSLNEVIEQEYPISGKFGIAMWGYENATRSKGEQMDYFVGNFIHELSHIFHYMARQEDDTHVHDYVEASLRNAYIGLDVDSILPRWDEFCDQNEWIHEQKLPSRVKNFVINYKKQYYKSPNILEWSRFNKKKYEFS